MLGRRRRQLDPPSLLSTTSCVMVLPSLLEPLWERTLSYPTQSACPTCLPFKNQNADKNTDKSCHAHHIRAISSGRCHWTKTICHSERGIYHSKEKTRQDGSGQTVDSRVPSAERVVQTRRDELPPLGHMLTQASHASRILLWRPCGSCPTEVAATEPVQASRRGPEAAHSNDALTGASLLDRSHPGNTGSTFQGTTPPSAERRLAAARHCGTKRQPLLGLRPCREQERRIGCGATACSLPEVPSLRPERTDPRRSRLSPLASQLIPVGSRCRQCSAGVGARLLGRGGCLH